MNTIKIRVTKNHLEIVKRNIITSDNIGYVECVFTFDPDWDGATKNIVLINENNSPVTDLIRDDQYVIPVSLLTRVWGTSKGRPMKLRIGVVGYRSIEGQEELQRITTDFVEVDIVQGSYIEDAMKPSESKPDIYQQLLANLVTNIVLTEDGKVQLMAGAIPIGTPIDLQSYVNDVVVKMIDDGVKFVEYATDEDVDDVLDAVYGSENN